MLDLEKVANRSDIDRSYDLRLALNTSKLRLCSQGIIAKNSKPEIHTIEKIIEKHHHHEVEVKHSNETINEARIIEIMRTIIAENQTKTISNKVLDALTTLNQKLESIEKSSDSSKSDILTIDPEKLAEMQLKAIKKISDDIETGNNKKGRKVILKNTRLDDLANEL